MFACFHMENFMLHKGCQRDSSATAETSSEHIQVHLLRHGRAAGQRIPGGDFFYSESVGNIGTSSESRGVFWTAKHRQLWTFEMEIHDLGWQVQGSHHKCRILVLTSHKPWSSKVPGDTSHVDCRNARLLDHWNHWWPRSKTRNYTWHKRKGRWWQPAAERHCSEEWRCSPPKAMHMGCFGCEILPERKALRDIDDLWGQDDSMLPTYDLRLPQMDKKIPVKKSAFADTQRRPWRYKANHPCTETTQHVHVRVFVRMAFSSINSKCRNTHLTWRWTVSIRGQWSSSTTGKGIKRIKWFDKNDTSVIQLHLISNPAELLMNVVPSRQQVSWDTHARQLGLPLNHWPRNFNEDFRVVSVYHHFRSNQWFRYLAIGIFLYFGWVPMRRHMVGLRGLKWSVSDFSRIIKEPQFASFTGILVAQEFSGFHEILPSQQAHWKPSAGRPQVSNIPKVTKGQKDRNESYHFWDVLTSINENSWHSQRG